MRRLLFVMMYVILLIIGIYMIIKFAENYNVEDLPNCTRLSDHQKMEIRSPELAIYVSNALQELSDFNSYSIENDILYTLDYGSVLGWCTLREVFPWDDDIDIVVQANDWDKLIDLWNTGEVVKRPSRYADDWEFREINLNNQRYYMTKRRGRESWYKFIKLGDGRNLDDLNTYPDLGGLDVFHPYEENTHGETFKSKPIKVTFSGTDTFILYDEDFMMELEGLYGPMDSWGCYKECLTRRQKSTIAKNLAKLKDERPLNSRGVNSPKVKRKL